MKQHMNASRSAVNASVTLAPVIAASLLLLPIYVSGLITQNGYSLDNALSIVSLEMWGMAASLVPAIYLMKRMSWRSITFFAIWVMIVAFCIPAFIDLSLSALAITRFIGGLGAGMAMAVVMAVIGRAEKPDKAFSLWVLSQVLFKVCGIFIISRLLIPFGMMGFFVPLLLLCVLSLFLVKYLPDGVDTKTGDRPTINWSIAPILALIGVFMFYIAISAIWANFERIGVWSGFEGKTIANILSFTSLASLGGASAATLVSGHLKRHILLIVGLALIAGATFMLGRFSSITAYSIIALVFAFAWFFSVPFIISSVNANDKTGQLMVYTNSAIAIGLAVGPSVAAFLIVGEGFKALTLFGGAVFIAAFLFLLPSNKASKESR